MPSRFAVTDFRDTVIVDEADATTVYVGRAKPGSATASSVWAISRTKTVGAVTTTAFAGGTAEYDKVWDDRASFTYT